MKALARISLCLAASLASGLSVQPSPLFTDHAVLQDGRPVPVWGSAAPGEKIVVRFKDVSAAAAADVDGSWKTELPPLRTAFPFRTDDWPEKTTPK